MGLIMGLTVALIVAIIMGRTVGLIMCVDLCRSRYRPPDVSNNYQLSWFGAEWDETFMHITDCEFE